MENKKSGGQFKYEFPKLNEKFTYWTVIDSKPVKDRKNWKVLCQCECGNEMLVRVAALRNGLSKGCKCKSGMKVTSVGNLSLTLFSRFKKSAKVRGIEFNDNVDMNFLSKLFVKQDSKCAISGLELILETSLCRGKGKSNITASLDRIDSSKGYIKGNVQWVHKHINIMKNKFDNNYFIEICKQIANNKI